MYNRKRRDLSAVPDPDKVRKGKGAWAKGNHRVSAVIKTLAEHGYRTIKASASGRSSKRTVAENRIAGDFLAMAPRGAGLPHLCVEVGGRKSVVAEIKKMGEMPEGTVPVVVMFLDGKRWYYLNSDEKFRKVEDLLDTMRSGSTEAYRVGLDEEAA
jgi:Holliday junction resolvase